MDILTHWGRVTHICVSKFSILGSDNGLSPGRRQTIIWTNAGLLLIGPLGTNFNEIVIKIQENAFEMVVWKMAAIWSIGLNVLNKIWPTKLRKMRTFHALGERDSVKDHFALWNIKSEFEPRCGYFKDPTLWIYRTYVFITVYSAWISSCFFSVAWLTLVHLNKTIKFHMHAYSRNCMWLFSN